MSSNWDGQGSLGNHHAAAQQLIGRQQASQNFWPREPAVAKRACGPAVMDAVRALERLRSERGSSQLHELCGLVDSDYGAPGSDSAAVRASVAERFESRRAALVRQLVDAAAEELWPEELARDVMET
jgi:hypothetical protein